MIAHQDSTQEANGLAVSEAVEGEAAAGVDPKPSCCHYWIIETANGPISRGQCQYCHEFRDFKNSVFDMGREDQDASNKQSQGPKAVAVGPEAPPDGLKEPGIPGAAEASEFPEIVAA